MKPSESEARFRKRLGTPLKDLTAREGIEAMLAFYKEQRAKPCAPLDEDGDMLLYQWGPEGKAFLLDLARQFILPDEDEPYQLALTFRYPSDTELDALKDGNEWCSTPNDLPAFRRFIAASETYRRLADRKPRSVRLGFSAC